MNATRSMILMNRLVLGGATDRDWAEWTQWADSNPDAWRQLALAQREQQMLSDLVGGHGQIAEAIDLPDVDEALSEDDAIVAKIGAYEAEFESTTRSFGWTQGGEVMRDVRHRSMSQRTWSRLAIAALVLLTLTITQFMMSTPNNGNVENQNTAGFNLSNLSAQDALEHYLDRGREEGIVIDEIPARYMIDSVPNPNGEGYLLLYVRQIVERVEVPELYFQDGTTDTGEPVMVEYAARRPRLY